MHNEVSQIKPAQSKNYLITLVDNGIEYTFNLLAKPIKKVHQFDEIYQKNIT